MSFKHCILLLAAGLPALLANATGIYMSVVPADGDAGSFNYYQCWTGKGIVSLTLLPDVSGSLCSPFVDTNLVTTGTFGQRPSRLLDRFPPEGHYDVEQQEWRVYRSWCRHGAAGGRKVRVRSRGP